MEILILLNFNFISDTEPTNQGYKEASPYLSIYQFSFSYLSGKAKLSSKHFSNHKRFNALKRKKNRLFFTKLNGCSPCGSIGDAAPCGIPSVNLVVRAVIIQNETGHYVRRKRRSESFLLVIKYSRYQRCFTFLSVRQSELVKGPLC